LGDSRCIAHALHTASNDHTLVARSNRLGCEDNGLETTRADFVDGSRIRSDRHASAERNLSCRGLADASLHDVTEEDLLCDRRVNFGLFEGSLEGNDAELGRGEGFEATIEGADGGARSGDNNNFVGAVIRLFTEKVGKLRCGEECGGRTIERVMRGNR